MNIARGLKAAAKALTAGPQAASFRAGGKIVACPHCENVLFHARKASLNTALTSLTHLEWTDREACVLVCANCSRLEWFLDDLTPEKA